MSSAKYILVGNIHFAIEHLQGQTLTEIKAMFPNVRVEILKTAWEKANPKKKNK
jgi:hypothetical protein